MSQYRPPSLLVAIAALALSSAACASPAAAPTPTVTARATPVPASPSPTEADSPQASASEAVQVLMDLSRFDPEELTIAVGTEVVFVNAAPFEHTVTEGTGGRAVADPIIDEEVAVDESASFTFDEPRGYDITCRIHPTMQLTITVEG